MTTVLTVLSRRRLNGRANGLDLCATLMKHSGSLHFGASVPRAGVEVPVRSAAFLQAPGMELSQKKILITGGTSGIGRALAETFVHRGAEVFVCGTRRERAAQVEADLGVRALVCDLSSREGVQRLAQVARAEMAGVDILINNAGVMFQATIGRAESDEEYLRSLDFVEGVGEIETEVLFLAGACDSVIGEEHQRRLVRHFQNSHLVVIPEAGHYMFNDQPQRSLEAVGR